MKIDKANTTLVRLAGSHMVRVTHDTGEVIMVPIGPLGRINLGKVIGPLEDGQSVTVAVTGWAI